MKLRYPSITGRSPSEQIGELRSFLFQLVDELNYALKEREKDTAESAAVLDHLPNLTAGDVLAFADACPMGITSFVTDDDSTNLPSNLYKNDCGIVQKRSGKAVNIYITAKETGTVAFCTKLDGGWSLWKYFTPQS